MMAFLERHTQLAELSAAHRDAAAGQGSIVAVTGEAGVGKTTVVQRFADDCEARVLWGLCDDLVTPRPLGPFRDMFAQLAAEPDAPGFLDAVLDELERPPHPTVAVVDDAQWADQATLDAVRFVGRRIGRMRALLIVTYREDEVPADHPLRLMLGALPAADVRRVGLNPLSRDAVGRLARDGQVEPDELYALTGGNPFFVREVLASPGARVPETVQDAVMARVGRLGSVALGTVEVASVVPGRAEPWLLAGCGVAAGLDPATRMGVLSVDPDGTVAFANELGRRAIENSLPPWRRRQINQDVLDILVQHDAEPGRLTHHAMEAGNTHAVARFAPVAARQAGSLESHRVAAEHDKQALAHPEHLEAVELAELYEHYARECRLIGEHANAQDAVEHALKLATEGSERQGRCLSLLSEVVMLQGRRAAADEAAAAAAAVLEALPPSRALVDAYAQRARLAMMGGHPEGAIEYGGRARAHAADQSDAAAVAHIDVTLAVARWHVDADASALLEEQLEATRASGLTYPTARAYVSLAGGNALLMRYEQADHYAEEGLAYCRDNDQLLDAGYLLVNRALGRFDQGRWHEAQRDAAAALDAANVGPSRIASVWIRGLIQARRGDRAAAMTIDQLRRLAEDAGEPRALLRAWSARAELAFLAGSDGEPPPPGQLVELVMDPSPWPWSRDRGDAALWLARSGALADLPPGLEKPRVRQIEGRWREAARAWAAAGRPYDEADALADALEPEPLLKAVEILDRLGAEARAAMVRGRLAAMGVAAVPRGPRRATRAHPAGLTPRQAEVLDLLADDLSYQQIANRLHVSIKTVDHHVTALRTKLDVSSRNDAVAVGRRLGLLVAKDRDGAGQT